MKNIFENWKTSLLGGGALTLGINTFIENPDNWQLALSQIIMGLLGLFAVEGKKKKPE